MAKRLKVRICRVISTTLNSCRSKDPSILPQNPAALPSFNPTSAHRYNSKPSSELNHHHHRPSFNRHVTSALLSVGCAGNDRIKPDEFKWRKEEKWHVLAKIYDHPTCRNTIPRRKTYNSSASCDDSDSDDLRKAMPPPPPPSSAEKKKRRVKKKRSNIPTSLRVSTSSADNGWFSSEGGGDERDDEETETLVSSSISCLSTDSSSDLHSHRQPPPPLEPIGETRSLTPASFSHHQKIHTSGNNKRRPSNKRPKRGSLLKPLPSPPPSAAAAEIPARLSVFQKLMPCTVEGKVKDSFAVVKRSADPYEDFKNSMMDMIVEKQMFSAEDLEQLLQCFLSLNSRHYHGIIVEAFSEIWEALFSHRSGDEGYYLPVSGGHQYHRRRPVSGMASF